MLFLFPFTRIVGAVAVAYGAIVAIIVAVIWMFTEQPTLTGSVSIAFSGATTLNLLLLGLIHFGCKWLWTRVPSLNSLIFPNLNGIWEMTISYVAGGESGSVGALATVKQDLLRISMEVRSENSDSETLIMQPKRDSESGTPILYYVYRVVPKQTNAASGQPYLGSAILKIYPEIEDGINVSGNYFTDRLTRGHFILRKRRSTGSLELP